MLDNAIIFIITIQVRDTIMSRSKGELILPQIAGIWTTN